VIHLLKHTRGGEDERESDWREIDETHFEAYRHRVALVETLLDESIDEADRLAVRRRYIEEHGVTERTIRNYLRRYREEGAEGLLFHRPRGPRSPRIHDLRLREKFSVKSLLYLVIRIEFFQSACNLLNSIAFTLHFQCNELIIPDFGFYSGFKPAHTRMYFSSYHTLFSF